MSDFLFSLYFLGDNIKTILTIKLIIFQFNNK
jgi:hypothetical protein